MNMISWIGATALAGLCAPGVAAADHMGMAMDRASEGESSVTADLSVLAADFDTMYYVGDYQGVVPSLRWSRGALVASASLPMYRLQENGLASFGLGDALVTGGATLAQVGDGHVGAMLMASLPTGNTESGFGMGHVMAMPMAWGTWPIGRVTLTASGGYSRALAGLADHVHGTWPLVEPMNLSEVTWGGGAEMPIVGSVRVGARVSGGIAVGGPGIDRVVGGAHVGWGRGRVTTTAELQAGLAGDPFTLRAVVDTALRF